VNAVLRIAHHLETEGKSYRIITPYDAQRTVVENGLKEKGLSWEDKCFNVDSFQGLRFSLSLLSFVMLIIVFRK
jgi:regulator of nonsense transcripts 1